MILQSISMTHEQSLTVRSYECDINGHVNNAVYLNYLEIARVGFLKNVNISYRRLDSLGYGLILVRVGINFRSPAFMEDNLRVVTRPIKKRLTGGVFEQKIYHNKKLIAEAEVTWVCVDRNKRPVRLPPELDIAELAPCA